MQIGISSAIKKGEIIPFCTLFQKIIKIKFVFVNFQFNFALQSTFKMSNTEEQLEALKDIRSMMERSSRFMSLNGLSGVFVGIFALAGALVAYLYIETKENQLPYFEYARDANGHMNISFLSFFIMDALLVLFCSLAISSWLTIRKAKKQGLKILTPIGIRLFYNMAIPLLSGGLFCIIITIQGYAGLVAPATLIFYGLALVNSSKYTYEDIRYLGLLEIALGLFATVFIANGLIFWAIGFGLLHIIYGIAMYYKYERVKTD